MSNGHILVVEDVLLLRNQLRVRLQSEGYRVTVASNVAQALHAVRAEMPDLVVLDLTLPDEDPFSTLTDGFAFLRMLRTTHADAEAAVVVYTGNKTPDIEARAKAVGVAGIVSKKEGTVALLEAIRSALHSRNGNNSETSRTPQDSAAGI